MKTLIIDTATSNLYIALVDDTFLDEVYKKNIKNHSEHLMNEIEALFIKNNIKPSDLDQIVCGIGPGSYTGVRIGLTVAKMLAYSLNIPLKAISSLYMMGSTHNKFASIIDAKRGYVFAGYYENGKSIIPEGYIELEEFKRLVEGIIVTDNDYKVDCNNVIKYSYLVDTNLVEPNYLRETEAERNL